MKRYPGPHKEIGWHNLQFFPALGDYKIFKDLPTTRKVFHWHGDTFNIPEGATRIAASQAFPHQGFIYDNKVVALQFHLEVTPKSVRELVENCRDELVDGPPHTIRKGNSVRTKLLSKQPGSTVSVS